MFRTIRLYDHGAPTPEDTDPLRSRDKIYDYFSATNPDGTLPGVRVNPLSDIPEVLDAAIANPPLDYFYAASSTPVALRKVSTFTKSPDHFNNSQAEWKTFKDAWTIALQNATPQINRYWKSNLSDVYGKWIQANGKTVEWYSDKVSRTDIFNISLNKPLHEIDRKMLYSFSLDSFSDRQQLFLYILRAEATIPSFGGAADSNVKSLAGGRAVALVWRDPYPQGYDKTTDTYIKNDEWYFGDKSVDSGGPLVSPWYQHNINKYDDNKDDDSGDETIFNNRPNEPTNKRLNGYHEHRILYFKQLDN